MMEAKPDSWRLVFRRVPHLDDLTLLHASNITHYYPLHLHEEYSLVMVLGGTETHICRGKRFVAHPGDLMFLNAEEAHASDSVASEYRVIHIKPRALARIAFETTEIEGDLPYFLDPVVSDASLFRALLELHLSLEQNVSRLEHDSALVLSLAQFFQRLSSATALFRPVGKEARRIKQVQDYLKSNYVENVSLADLASIVDLSPYYLLRMFRENVGVPPHEYQTQLRVARARQLMVERGCTISDAAVESGFFDQSHLSRNFKRIVGVTPARYLAKSNIIQDTGAQI